ncbi:Ubiquitin carboxyl-terminal hydrolase 14 [Madurella mycetomatis]|uniref:ubiquitinyl hydrolase 1 n=1 Tax=Madurella mycetomatis TaxID=100816 RepID=A0A175W4R0_9PEZI|nr:Ubiquitin carboxyl-terminal hydrolase 14 [Madurella mycetomatis]
MEKMKAASLMPRKFRSVREKNGNHRRNRSVENGGKSRPLTADSFLSFFRPDSAKQALKEKEEEEKEAAKIEDVSKRLQELNYHEISKEVVRYALNSKFAGGDIDKAVELLQLQQKAFAGIVQPYNPNVEMLGAENRGNVTCYLDALLFAMFAKLTAFECMLKNDLADESQNKLAALLRLWVNMLRSGKLIHEDMTQHIQETLAACGWKDAQLLEQQDTSEAFAFITETLQLPLLALQVDLFHQGKRDADDHKVVHERLLNLAVPPDPDGKGIKLEDCLEEYFNNQVDVLRDSLEEKKGGDRPVLSPKSTIRIVTEEEVETPHPNAETAQLQRSLTEPGGITYSPVSMSTPASVSFDTPSAPRTRSTSIIQRIVVDGEGRSPDPDTTSLAQRAKLTGSTVVKAVTIPAWQFFRLIPWHAASNGEPSNDVEVARHFNQRPVVGICLKRYTMTEQGVPKRHNTLIDIPDSLRLPHFMVVDDVNSEQASNGLSQEYKLVLQSVVCHRGDSLHSGHYVAFARVAPKLLTDNRRHDHDPPPDYEEAQWVKFDDLAIEKRVTYVDDIKKSLREEMPYLLFYQIVPMVDITAASTDGSVADPPSYIESATTVPGTPSVEVISDYAGSVSRPTSGYFDSATTLPVGAPSIRLSSDVEQPTRYSFDDGSSAAPPKTNNSRRGSVSFSEPAAHPSGVSPEGTTPAITPQDESTGTRLSRAAAMFSGKTGSSKSRATSQVGEGRMSITMSRLGFGRTSKEFPNGASSSGRISSEVTAEDRPAPVDGDEAAGKGKEKEKDKEHHGPHLPHPKKDRNKSKSREKEKDKDKGKASKEAVPDRECMVM